MTFNQFAIRNVIRNKHLYVAYFLSTVFTVMVFFTFAIFLFHPSLNTPDLKMQVRVGMMTAASIIYIFSFFFIIYSMDIFLQSRKREFGTLMIQGMSPKQLKRMVFIENMIIGLFATIGGSLLGLVFSKLILWISGKMIHVNLPYYFPGSAILLTFVSFVILFLLISFFIQFKLPKLNVQELLKSEALGKGELKASAWKSILAILLIVGGYIIALSVKATFVFMVMIPVIIMVVIGTNLFFNQLSIFVVNRLKKNKRLFWKKTNIMVFSDLSFRMKDNARAFFLVAIISTVAFSAIGSLYGVRQLILGGFSEMAYPFSYADMQENNPAGAEQFVQNFQKTTQEMNVGSQSVTVPYLIGPETNNRSSRIVSQDTYNQAAKLFDLPTIHVAADEAVQVSGEDRVDQLKIDQTASFKVKEDLQKVDVLDTPGNGCSYVIANDKFADLQSKTSTYYFVGAKLEKDSYENQIKVGKKFSDDMNVFPKEYNRQVITNSYAPVLFIGLFIGIVFFVSAGSFLYFRLYSDSEVDIKKFKMVYRIGLTKREMKKMIYEQVGILFFTPIIVSTIHGAVALTAMYHMFGRGIQLDAVYVLVAFIVIQTIYYLVARTFYFRKVYQAVVG